MRSPLLSGAGFAVVCALVLWSCGGGSSSGGGTPAAPTPTPTPTPAPAPTTQTVVVSIVGSIGNSAYRPNPVPANTGDTVMFRNNDASVHHVVLDDGSADLGDIQPGATSRGVVLKNALSANYHCTNHPSMVGSINGSTAPEPTPCPDPYGYGC